MNLDMALSQIEKTKQDSRIGRLKARLQKTLFTNVAPLIASKDFSSSFNLFKIPQLLPLQKILSDLDLQNDPDATIPADFIVVIAPRLPESFQTPNANPYISLYPSSKAAVYTDPNAISPLGNYEEIVNQRMFKGAEYLFSQKYHGGTNTLGFFAGAIISIHLQGANSSASAKLAIGLPTDRSLPFEQENDQIKLKQIYFPRSPYNGYVTKMAYPIAMVSVTHTASSPASAALKIDFGDLGPIAKNRWDIGNEPSHSVIAKWFSWRNPYNVPHFRGEIRSLIQKEMLGRFAGFSGWLNGFLANHFDIQLNLHSVTLDLQKLVITDVAVTVDLPKSGGSELLPTLHVPDPEVQFKNEGNKAIQEQKDKIKPLLDSGLNVLSDPQAQKKFIEILNSLLGSANSGGDQ